MPFLAAESFQDMDIVFFEEYPILAKANVVRVRKIRCYDMLDDF